MKSTTGTRRASRTSSSLKPSTCSALPSLNTRLQAPGTDVCLEGGFGDEPGGACLCRAQVADTRTGEVLLEVREAKPDSRWFHKEQNQYWFEEGALVDLYLNDHGY